MSRNLVLCLDGTSNEFAPDRTNVVKLAHALVKDERQRVYYHPGLGTMAPPGAWTDAGTILPRLAGLAVGYGLKSDVAAAYTFIADNYRAGDRIYLFGFSRGAYTARVVAALIHLYGLVMPGNGALVPYMVRMLWAITRARGDPAKTAGFFDLARAFGTTLAAIHPLIALIGVWETVSSVGWIGSPLALPYTAHNPSIDRARHAVAIDERRAFFQPNLFTERHGSDVRQVWFPGSHEDVGGGHPEAESGLSKFALGWMAAEADDAGVLLDDARLAAVMGGDPAYARPDAAAPLHESLTPGWWSSEFVPKRHWDAATGTEGWRINRGRRRHLGATPCVHDAAWDVPDGYARRLPPGAVRLSAKMWPAAAPMPAGPPSP